MRPAVSTNPTNNAPKKAPRIEPIPPITITTKAKIKILSPIPTCTARSGPSIPPATAHSAAPTPNTAVNKPCTWLPIAIAMSRFAAPARTCIPTRVRVMSTYNNKATNKPTPIMSKRYAGYIKPGSSSTGPLKESGGFKVMGCAPHIKRTVSLHISKIAKVPNTCDR